MGLLKQLNGNKYSVIEVNFLAARRTGQVKAQLPLNTDEFSDDNKAQNGMMLVYDTVEKEVSLPTDYTTPVLLHFSVEKEYDHLRPGLKNFALAPGEFYPRLYTTNVGDTWTTDAVRLAADGSDDATVTSAYESLSASDSTLYGVDDTGFIDLQTDRAGSYSDAAFLVKIIEADTTLPNGGKAVKLEVVKAHK